MRSKSASESRRQAANQRSRGRLAATILAATVIAAALSGGACQQEPVISIGQPPDPDGAATSVHLDDPEIPQGRTLLIAADEDQADAIRTEINAGALTRATLGLSLISLDVLVEPSVVAAAKLEQLILEGNALLSGMQRGDLAIVQVPLQSE